jgi:hypothetical protein
VTTADDILNHIDDALDDWTVSGDAMRSRPGGSSRQELFVFGGFVPTVEIMDDAGEWQQVDGVVSVDFGGDDQVWVDEAFTHITVNTTAIMEQFASLRQSLAAFAEAAQPRIEEVGQALAKVAQHASTCDDHGQTARPRDRPAWQSPYGPARRRR